MSKNYNQVPRLDLAPKLKRPLSLWNPLDYLRLLYWVFFFPQAVGWYVEKFGGKYVIEGERNWQKRWEWLRNNPIKRQLFVQGLMLVVVIPVVLSYFLEQMDVPTDWSGAALGIICMIMVVISSSAMGSVAGSAAGAVAGGVAASVAFGVFSDLLFSIVVNALFGLMEDVALRTLVKVAANVTIGVTFGGLVGLWCAVPLAVVGGMPLVWAFGLTGAVIFGVSGVIGSSLMGGVASSVAFGVAFEVLVLRPENWLLGLPLTFRSPLNSNKTLPRITPLPIPYLSSQLKNCLRQDWETGMHNVSQLLKYTLQFIPVVTAVNRVLAETSSERVIYRVSQLTNTQENWNIVRFASASLSQELKLLPFKILLALPAAMFLSESKLQQLKLRFQAQTRLDTAARATAAGFWYLHEKQPEKSVEAFAIVRNFPYGKEMLTLAYTLVILHKPKQLATVANLQLPLLPTEPLLRPTTWEAIKSLQRVIADTKAVQRSTSRSARSLGLNRAQGEVKRILDNIETIPQAERELIKEIAQTWGNALLELTAEVGQVNITEPVRIPYTIGDPVMGKQFVGREGIIRDLKQLWILSDRPQSIVLYGHRRMGKTSILLNIANLLGAKVKLAYINLLRVSSNPKGVGEVLIAIANAIAKEVNLERPSNDDLLNLPYPNFERYINRVIDNLDGSLIVALDEFEKIEKLIANEKIPPDFMEFLRGMVQMSPKLAFALAGLHTLEEMTEDYFHPFFASIIPIRVGFLTHGATRQILANPGDEDFLLDYQPEALDRIYQLTHGQPYLVQLVGFLLVRRYNELTFESGRPQKNIFTIEDVEAVIDNPDFYSHGRYYFTGVWDQAARGAKGQQQILTALAPHQKQGLTLPALSDATGIDTPEMQTALETLERHDVVKPDGDNRWQIAVELLRRWVANR